MYLTIHTRRVTTLSKLAGLIGFVVSATLIPSQVRASGLTTGTLNLSFQANLEVNLLAELFAHPSDSSLSSFLINPSNTSPVPAISLGPDKHGTTSSHGFVASWSPAGTNLVNYIITPVAAINPKCESDFSTCTTVLASTSVGVTPGPGVTIIGFNTSEVQAQGIEQVPGPLPILGAAAAFGWSRKLRRRIKASKPELISTTAL